MHLSDKCRQLAEEQNEILKALYKADATWGFDKRVDLSSFQAEQLGDFWLRANVYMAILKIDEILNHATDKQIAEILGGHFKLRNLSYEQVEKFAENVGKKIDKGHGQTIKLAPINDGVYSLIVKNGYYHLESMGELFLDTDPVTIYTDEKDLDDKQILTYLRNILAHESPIINGNKLVFKTISMDAEISALWLRGLNEMELQKANVEDPDSLYSKIENVIKQNHLHFKNISDLEAILDALKDEVHGEISEHFKYAKDFCILRTRWTEYILHRPLEEKIQFLADILYFNSKYYIKGHQRVNPNVIYLLLKFMDGEIQKRDAVFATPEQLKVQEIIELSNKKTELEQKILNHQKRFPIQTPTSRVILGKLFKEYDSLKKEAEAILAEHSSQQKYTSSDMALFSSSKFENLTMETAFNILCLMGFNSLVTSSFVDDVLTETSFFDMNQTQKDFIGQINMERLSFYKYNNGKRLTPETPEDKAYILLGIRNALIHNATHYYINPENIPYVKSTFSGGVMVFESTKQHIKVVGSFESFFRLFSSNEFFLKRPEDLVSKIYRPKHKKTDTEESSIDPTVQGQEANETFTDDQDQDTSDNGDQPGGDE